MDDPFQAHADRVNGLLDERVKLNKKRKEIEVQVTEIREARDKNDRDIARVEQQMQDIIVPPAVKHTLPLQPIAAVVTPPTAPRAVQQENIETDDEDIITTPRSRRDVTPRTVIAPTELDMIHPNFPTVIFFNGAWSEIWCGRCGSNSTQQRFVTGAKGVHKHCYMAHKNELDKTLKDCIGAAKRRLVSATDVDRMRAGEAPLEVAITLKLTDDTVQRKAATSAAKASKARMSDVLDSNSAVAPSTPRVGTPSLVRKRPAENGEDSAKTVTEWEVYQEVIANATEVGVQAGKRQRTSSGRPNYEIQSVKQLEQMDAAEED
ncbi:hypothetical protein LTS10_002797 [Elasticomyces elasticus]|nr:hypothetical protein LTS10_002797 [Elasticomyces elasticus]